MEEKRFVKIFRTAKIIQLCVTLGVEAVFFIVLVFHPERSRYIYEDNVLFSLCSLSWILMILNLLFLFYDFWELRSFAVESHALNQAAYLDNLTGMPNRHSLDTVFQTFDTPEAVADAGCLMTTLSNLKEVNEKLGRTAGDTMIRDFSSILEDVGDSVGIVGRNGGNEFILVVNHCDTSLMEQTIQTLQNKIDSYNASHASSPIQLHSAYLLNKDLHAQAFTQLLTATYNKLHS